MAGDYEPTSKTISGPEANDRFAAACADGLSIPRGAEEAKARQKGDAIIPPLADSDVFSRDIDLEAVTELWRYGSLISTWPRVLTAGALSTDQKAGAMIREAESKPFHPSLTADRAKFGVLR